MVMSQSRAVWSEEARGWGGMRLQMKKTRHGTCDKVGGIGGKGTVPHPPLVARQCLLECELLRVPDLDGVVGRSCGE